MYRLSTNEKIAHGMIYLILIALTLAFLIPFIIVLSTSFISEAEFARRGGYVLFPEGIDLGAYQILFGRSPVILNAYAQALRVYERAGLLKPARTVAGWRVYRQSELERLSAILALKQLGLPLKRIGELLRGTGDLAAALALMARDQRAPLLAGQILLSPMLDPCLATCSVREAKAGPAGCQWADGWHQYLGSAVKAAHPYASPIGSSRLARLAPALLVTSEDDLLRDETLNYARRLQESGVSVRAHLLSAPTGWPCALHYGADQGAPWRDSLRERFAEFFADTLTCPSAASFQHHVQA